MVIKECFIFDDDDTGTDAIGWVNDPANKDLFLAMKRQYFAKHKKFIRGPEDITQDDLDVKYKWILNSDNEIDNKVCLTCVEWSNKPAMKLRDWVKTALPRVKVGTPILDMVASGEHEPYNTFCEETCGCHLEAVVEEKMESETIPENLSFQFSKLNTEKREVVGLALKSKQFIYRNDILGNKGYIYFSRETIRKIYKKFGYNRTVTYEHEYNITGSVILMKSYLIEDDENNETRWMLKYKVVSDKLWKDIKDKIVKGFSVEIQVRLK